MNQQTTRRTTLGVLGATAVLVGTLIPGVAAAQQPPPELGQPYEWVEEFDSEEALETWNIFQQPDYNYEDALYTEEALEVRDGKLIITTQRHCVDEDIDLSDAANHGELDEDTAQVEPCAPDEFQKFTSGRLNSPEIARGNFELSVTATMNTADQEGVRSAIWMQNGENACSRDDSGVYGELDLVEYFPHEARRPWSPSNTHLTCDEDGWNGTYDAPRELHLGESLNGVEHTWSVDTSGEQVAYFIDGDPINRETWNHENVLGHASREDFGLTAAGWQCVMDRPWTLTLNQKVENADWTHPTPADEPFPVRSMEIERVEVSGVPADGPADPCAAPQRITAPADELGNLSSQLSSGALFGLGS